MTHLAKLIISLTLLIFHLSLSPVFSASLEQPSKIADEAMLDKVEKATFQWFLDNTHPKTGLIADRTGFGKSPATVAGTGFGLAAYAIASERGWISRTEAIAYTLKVLNGLYHSPQGLEKEGFSGYKGFFYHFLDPETGLRATAPKYWNSELSSIDTALLMAGVIFARNYYQGETAQEIRIRELSNALYERVEWPWLLTPQLLISHGYTPEAGMIPYAYKGYSEALLLYVLALSSEQHPIPAESWDVFMADAHIGKPSIDSENMIMVPGMPLFTYQYPMAFIDFRKIQDSLCRGLGLDYFENSRRATLAQWEYAQKNESMKRGYDQYNWGLTACDGPGNEVKTQNGKEITFRAYSERGAPQGFDDGTIAPTAAISSIVYTPSIVLKTMHYWLKNRPELFNKHGFTDAFNPTFFLNTNSGWVDPDRLSIDQGPIIMMIENYRTGLIWNMIRKDEQIKQGLQRAGFTGGWIGN